MPTYSSQGHPFTRAVLAYLLRDGSLGSNSCNASIAAQQYHLVPTLVFTERDYKTIGFGKIDGDEVPVANIS